MFSRALTAVLQEILGLPVMYAYTSSCEISSIIIVAYWWEPAPFYSILIVYNILMLWRIFAKNYNVYCYLFNVYLMSVYLSLTYFFKFYKLFDTSYLYFKFAERKIIFYKVFFLKRYIISILEFWWPNNKGNMKIIFNVHEELFCPWVSIISYTIYLSKYVKNYKNTSFYVEVVFALNFCCWHKILICHWKQKISSFIETWRWKIFFFWDFLVIQYNTNISFFLLFFIFKFFV